MGSVGRVGLVGVFALLLAGCSSGGGGYRFGVTVAPSTETAVVAGPVSSATEPKDDVPKNGAPEVTDPLDVERVLVDPCEALGDDQLRGLGFGGPGEFDTFRGEDQCKWRMADSSLQIVTIRPAVSPKESLSDVYGKRDRMAYFKPTTIGGYPAVYASPIDQRDGGNCQLLVGVSDDQLITVAATFLQVEPCPVVGRTAEAMIEHLSDNT